MLALKEYFALRYMRPFYEELIPTTPALVEFKARGFGNSFAWASNRMADDVEAMLGQWRQEQHDNKIRLPIALMAIRRGYMQTAKEFSRPVADAVPISPNGIDYIGLRSIPNDWTIQVACIAPNDSDTESFITQLCLFASSPRNRRFYVDYPVLNGEKQSFSAVLENNELMPESVDSQQKNIAIHKVDLLFHHNQPYVMPIINQPYEITVNEVPTPVFYQ